MAGERGPQAGVQRLMKALDNPAHLGFMWWSRKERNAQSLRELMHMVSNQVLPIIHPDLIWDAAKGLVVAGQHRITDRSRHHESVWGIVAEASSHDQARGAVNHQGQIRADFTGKCAVGRRAQITDQDVQGGLVVDLPDSAVGVMRDGVRQAITVAELFLPPISQQAHRGWDLCADGAHLPQAGGCFPRRGRVLAGQFMHEAHGGIPVGEAQVFDGKHHLRAHAMMLALVLTSTWSQPSQPLTPEACVIIP